MNKHLLYLLFLLLPAVLRAQDVPVPEKPNPNRLVNDLAHVLTPDQAAQDRAGPPDSRNYLLLSH